MRLKIFLGTREISQKAGARTLGSIVLGLIPRTWFLPIPALINQKPGKLTPTHVLCLGHTWWCSGNHMEVPDPTWVTIMQNKLMYYFSCPKLDTIKLLFM